MKEGYPILHTVQIWGIRFAVDPEAALKTYLSEKMEMKKSLKIVPVTMEELWKIALFPSLRRQYQKMDIVYPDGWFCGRCLFRFNRQFQGERRIYSHRLILDLIGDSFQKSYPLTFVGLNENQKNNLKRRLRFLFSNTGDICFLHADMTRYQPQDTIIWLNRANYGLVVVSPSGRKLGKLLVDKVDQGLLFFDNHQMERYSKSWKKRSPWHSWRGLVAWFSSWAGRGLSLFRTLFGVIILYYPLLWVFSLSFWLFSFIINRAKPQVQDLT